jgi:hypothetical protein
MSRQYYGIEDMGLSTDQRQAIITKLKEVGDNQSRHPNYRNHRRVRNDGMAVIFEGKFNDEDWTKDQVKGKIAQLFEMTAGERLKNGLGNLLRMETSIIDDRTQQTKYGPMITFSRGGDLLRMIAFGGLLATWKVSRQAVIEFLKDNKSEWEEEQHDIEEEE